MMNKLKEKAGFVSLETVIVTGVVIALGIFALTQYNETGQLVVNESIDRLTDVLSFDWAVLS